MEIFDIVVSITSVLSLLALLYQLRENAALIKASNTQSAVELSLPFNILLIENIEILDLWVNGASKYEFLSDLEKERYKNILVVWLIHHENIFYQRVKKLLDQEAYQAWHEDLRKFLIEQRVELIWNSTQNTYQPLFVKHVNQIIEEIKLLPEYIQRRELTPPVTP